MTQGETGPATGWFGRAQRLVERDGSDCVERGYLALPAVLGHAAAGAWESASAAAAEAAEIAERFGDQDLLYLALHEQGHALVRQGRVEEGLGLLDEAMVAVTAEELSPIVTGLLYCSVIGYCRELYELRRAQEWTAALTRVVAATARDGFVHRPVPFAPGRGHGDAGRLARGDRRSGSGRGAL